MGQKLLFGKIFAENCMKMKEIGLRGTSFPSAPFPLDPPMIKKSKQFNPSDIVGDITALILSFSVNEP